MKKKKSQTWLYIAPNFVMNHISVPLKGYNVLKRKFLHISQVEWTYFNFPKNPKKTWFFGGETEFKNFEPIQTVYNITKKLRYFQKKMLLTLSYWKKDPTQWWSKIESKSTV